MKKSWLSYVNLSDHYERKARFLPAVLAILPLLPVSTVFGAPLLEWLKLLGAGAGLWAIMAVAFSHIASALGNRLQDRLWPEWPHDAPTNRWLHPDDKSISMQQKQRYYKVIKDLLQLDIQAAIDASEADEIKAVINDSVQETRNLLWTTSEAERVRLHNVDYGFARNIAGLRFVWVSFSFASFAGCWYANIWNGGAIIWAIVSTVVAAGTPGLALLLPAYVRKKAHYYAESFFAAIVAVHNSKQKTPFESLSEEVL